MNSNELPLAIKKLNCPYDCRTPCPGCISDRELLEELVNVLTATLPIISQLEMPRAHSQEFTKAAIQKLNVAYSKAENYLH